MEKHREQIFIKRIKAGEFVLFEYFVKRYQNGLFRFILQIVKNRDEAMDLCQDTFLKAYKSISSYKGKSGFSTWLYRIGFNNSINHIKKNKRMSMVEIEKLNLRCECSDCKDLIRKEQKEAITGELNKLDSRYRTPLFLFFIEEKSYKEIAEIMKIPINSVKSYILRGKEAIRQALQSYLRVGV